MSPSAAAAASSLTSLCRLSLTLRRYGYTQELRTLLAQLVRDMDRKIDRQRERAEKENQPRPPSLKEQEQLDAVKARHAAMQDYRRSS